MIKIDKIETSEDKTRKYRFRTSQDEYFDAAVIFFDDSDNAPVNICISSQIGCKFHCLFCACGNKNFARDLTADEIIEQIDLIFKDIGDHAKSAFEITYMGSGDPLDNFDAVIESMLSVQKHQNLSRINVSTIIPSTKRDLSRFSEVSQKIHLQYSLNFIDDASRLKHLRNNTLPSIEESLGFLKTIAHNIHDRPCISYILFNGVNDSIKDAQVLCEYARRTGTYLKISDYVPIDSSLGEIKLEPSQHKESFCAEIKKQGIEYKLFKSKGIDVRAACGHFLSDVVL